MVPVKEIPPRSRSRVLALPGAHSRASSPATARTGPLACSGARRRPAPKSLPLRCSTPTRRAAPSPTGSSTGCPLASPAWRPCRPAPRKASTTSAGAATGAHARPRGAAHHYHVVVLALDTWLGLEAGARRSDLDSRISGHGLGRGELVATYRRA